MKDLATAVQDELTKQGKKPSEIQELYLDNKCKATNLEALREFTSLKELSASAVQLSSLEGFPSLPHLTKLVLADNRIQSGLSCFSKAGLTNLRRLDLSGNRISNFEEVTSLQGLGLKSLDLVGCPVSEHPDYRTRIYTMLDELEYLDNIDRNGHECDGDDDEEEDEFEEGGEGYEEEAGGEGEVDEDEDEDGEGNELEGEEPLEDDSEEYEGEGDDEAEDDEDGDEDDEGEEEGAGRGTKRPRAEEEEEEGDDE